MSEEALERRYRRLLAWYPATHRVQYEQEMLGVLMEGAGPERTHPTLSERHDLVRGALRARLRAVGPALAVPRWRDAAAVAALVGMLYFLERAAESLLWLRYTEVGHASLVTWGWETAAIGATVAIAAGTRLVAAALGWMLALCYLLQFELPTQPDDTNAPTVWMAFLALVVAAGLTVAVPARRAVPLLGRWRLVAMALAVGIQIAEFVPLVDGRSIEAALDLEIQWSRLAFVIATLLGPTVCAIAVLTLPGGVRRRALALLCAPAVGFAMHAYVLPYTLYRSVTGLLSAYLTDSWVQLLVVAVPMLSFPLALAVVHRRERAAPTIVA